MVGLITGFMLAGLLFTGSGAHAGGSAAAYLDMGLGARGPGVGSAYAAAVDGADATFWNPAGLVWNPGIQLGSSLLPMSLDRFHSSISAALNMRGDTAFGFAWIHAGAGDIQGRTGSGQPTGSINSGENAFLVSVAHAAGQRLSLGATLKILRHNLDVPGWNKAHATGHGFDVGLQFQLTEQVRLAAAARNLGASLDWTVRRSASQASRTTDDLQRTVLVAASFRPRTPLLLLAEVARDADIHASIGAEFTVNPMLTVRAGARRLPGEDTTPEALCAGFTLRPMRTDTLLFHYTFLTDQLQAGDRSVLGLSLTF